MAKKKAKKAKKAKKDEETALATTDGKQIARSAEEIDKEWAERVEELRKRKLTLSHDTLQFYYDVGTLATELTNSAADEPEYRKYGSHTSEELAQKLRLGKSTFYAAIQFVAFTAEKKLQRMKDAQMPWSAVQAWLTVEEAKERENVLKKIESGKIKTREGLRKVVSEINSAGTPPPPPPDGVTLALSQAKSFNTTISHMTTKALPELVESIKVYKKNSKKMSDATKVKFENEIDEAKKAIAVMTRMIGSAEKALLTVS